MRVAISGSHGVGKSTLIAAFLAERREYGHEPEAYEELADDVDLTSSEGPTLEGLQVLLEHTLATVNRYASDASDVVFERSPVDYLAYASASRSLAPDMVERFIDAFSPAVRTSLLSLDLIVFVPLSNTSPKSRTGESPRFRRRVDEALRRAFLDDDYDLFGDPKSARVVELPRRYDRQLPELIRLTSRATQ